MSKGIKKAPSRARYEMNHPTVSCRVPREVHNRLQTVKEKDAKSFADVLKVGLGILEEKAVKENAAYEQGYNEGFRQAEMHFKVTFRCPACGEEIPIDSQQTKEATKEYMEENGWRHRSCPES